MFQTCFAYLRSENFGKLVSLSLDFTYLTRSKVEVNFQQSSGEKTKEI
jgi:hypothetical protein